MNPMIKEFFNRIRMYPAFINCCTIDWFSDWPEEALSGVAQQELIDFLQDQKIEQNLHQIKNIFTYTHIYVQQLSLYYRNVIQRYNYVTPMSYLELIKLFKNLFQNKKNENQKQISRFENGLNKLNQANKDVEHLKEQLIREEPILKQAEEEVKEMIKVLEKDRKEAEKVKETVEVEELNAVKSEKEASEIKNQVESEVSESNQELEKTLQEMKGLTSKDVSLIYGFTNPVPKVKHLMIGLCYLFLDKKDINYKQNLSDEEIDNFFFIQARKLLIKDSKDLMDKINNFDKDNIDKF